MEVGTVGCDPQSGVDMKGVCGTPPGKVGEGNGTFKDPRSVLGRPAQGGRTGE